ncbi:MAG: hypothetical protein ABSE46_06550 [Terracidiphilus sp.]|jgi:hypothetical protein
MKRLLVGAIAFALGAIPVAAQSLDDLNIQIHGYATQGFLYSTNNNFFTTTTSNGSPAWTEAVMNVSARPTPKLRFAVQARYFLLGNYGNAVTIDFASADYKVNDKFGARFGKVKVPSGLFNETQDIDPSYIWALLPQSLYPITSRNSQLAVYGGVAYGTLALTPKLGKLAYRGWSGEVSLAPSDGYFVNEVETGTTLPNGMNGLENGTALHWTLPFEDNALMFGASFLRTNTWNNPVSVGYGAYKGTETLNPLNEPNYFAKYEKDKLMVAGEFQRTTGSALVTLPALGPYGISLTPVDDRAWYGMASYKITTKFTAGAYDSQYFSHKSALGPARYSKDWVASGRFDFNQFLYAKAEEHIIDGTAIGYDATLNAGGLKPASKLTILKMGVSF